MSEKIEEVANGLDSVENFGDSASQHVCLSLVVDELVGALERSVQSEGRQSCPAKVEDGTL